METEELVKLILLLLAIFAAIGIIIFLLSGKGGEILNSIRNLFRFGA